MRELAVGWDECLQTWAGASELRAGAFNPPTSSKRLIYTVNCPELHPMTYLELETRIYDTSDSDESDDLLVRL